MRRQRAIATNLDEELIDGMDAAAQTSRAAGDNATPPGRRQRSSSSPSSRRIRRAIARLFVAIGLVFLYCRELTNPSVERSGGSFPTARRASGASTTKRRADMGKIIYGAKGKGEDTARLVKLAIQSGFRHIATVSVVSESAEQ
jgi:hypothetical protein